MTATDTSNTDKTASDVDLDAIVAELDAALGRLPKDAIRAARESRERMVPKLIDVLRRATAGARSGALPGGDAHFFALFLLAEFKAKEALPAILEAISLPGDLPSELFGGAITSGLGRVLITLADDPLTLIDGLIRNRSLYQFVRWEAAESYVYFVRDGLLSRDEAVARLGQFLREAIDAADSDLTAPLICVLCSLGPQGAYDVIAEAYGRDLVDTSMVGIEDVDRAIAAGDEGLQETLSRLEPTAIVDTIEELSSWASFADRPAAPPPPPASIPSPLRHDRRPALDANVVEPSSGPRRERVGRNDPCPCGSGNKYKKCCGAARQSGESVSKPLKG